MGLARAHALFICMAMVHAAVSSAFVSPLPGAWICPSIRHHSSQPTSCPSLQHHRRPSSAFVTEMRQGAPRGLAEKIAAAARPQETSEGSGGALRGHLVGIGAAVFPASESGHVVTTVAPFTLAKQESLRSTHSPLPRMLACVARSWRVPQLRSRPGSPHPPRFCVAERSSRGGHAAVDRWRCCTRAVPAGGVAADSGRGGHFRRAAHGVAWHRLTPPPRPPAQPAPLPPAGGRPAARKIW